MSQAELERHNEECREDAERLEHSPSSETLPRNAEEPGAFDEALAMTAQAVADTVDPIAPPAMGTPSDEYARYVISVDDEGRGVRYDSKHVDLCRAYLAANERLNAPVRDVEAQMFTVELPFTSHRAEVVSADLARDLGRRLAAAKQELETRNGTVDILYRDLAFWKQRAEAAERQLAEAVAKERERCAKLCEFVDKQHGEHPEMALTCAAAIRGSSEGGGNG